jgi:hypothetical protein
VYSLAVGSDTAKKKVARLAEYASDSGGATYYALKGAAMEKLYAKITEEARHEYTLAYVPRGNIQSTDFHRVEVRTMRTGLITQTREATTEPRQRSNSQPRKRRGPEPHAWRSP